MALLKLSAKPSRFYDFYSQKIDRAVTRRILLTLVMGLLFGLAHLTAAHAQCSPSVTFDSLRKGSSAILDVSGCGTNIIQGLYVEKGTSLLSMPVVDVDKHTKRQHTPYGVLFHVKTKGPVVTANGINLTINATKNVGYSAPNPNDEYNKYHVTLDKDIPVKTALAGATKFTLY